MRMHKGKPVFSYKDTYSLDDVLSTIILAGLVKFRDTLKERDLNGKAYGVPIFDDNYEDESKSEKWFEILAKMIFAFDDKNEPDVSSYKIGFELSSDKSGGFCSISVSNQEGYDQYYKDMEDWNKKKQEGLDLFAKHYNNLWW